MHFCWLAEVCQREFLFDRRGGGPKRFGSSYIWNVCVAGDLDVFGIRFISLKMMIFYELLIREQ